MRARASGLASLLRSSVLLLPLAGCAALPSNGPTARRIEQQTASPANQIGYRLQEITPDTLGAAAPAESGLDGWATDETAARADIIRPGDTLSVTVYEVGVSLFGGPASLSPQIDTPSASAQRIGAMVDEDGRVSLPFTGSLLVAGRTPTDVQTEIEARLRVNSQHPQVLVVIADSVENSVYLSGVVAKPGRIKLTTAHEHLLDMIAIAGGPSLDKEDTEIHLVRGPKVAQVRLGDIRAEDTGNIRLLPGDRVELIKSPRTFSVFGATDKVSQVPFGMRSVSLSDAIARVGGPSDARANPKSI